jgi:uncharacterized delta-60 repeat protein
LLCASATSVFASALAASSPAARWRSEVQFAPGREVLPMRPQQDIPEMAALANGNIVVAGTYESEAKVNGGHLAVAELLPNGRLDPSFGDGGVVLSAIKLQPWQILAQPDGKILILGPNRSPGSQEPRITRFPNWQIVRLLPDGTPDPSFGHDGFMVVSGVPVPSEGPAHTIAPELAPNGDIYLATILGTLFTPTMTGGLVRLHPNGSRDTSFGVNGVVAISLGLEAFSLDSDGSLVEAIGSRTGTLLLRVGSPSGSPDPTFNGGSPLQLPAYSIDSLLVESDGAIELHGYPSSNSLIGSKIWRYTRSGAPDTSWGSGGAVDLPARYGYINQLLPESDGGSTLVTMGELTPPGAGADRARITRLTSAGQFDPTTGSSGLLVTLPFGGGTYTLGSIANLRQNSFTPTGVVERAGGGLLFNGSVVADEVINTEGGAELVAGIEGFALTALTPSYRLEPAFAGATKLRLSARVTSTRLKPNGVAVRLRTSHAALAVVTVTGAGTTIAKGTVPFFSIETTTLLRTVRIPLTRAGRRLARRRRRHVTVTVRVSAADLAANHATTHTSATLSG